MGPQITYQWLENTQLDLLAEIDRTEDISTAYIQRGRQLVRREVDWHAPAWGLEGEGEHSLYHMMSFCRSHLVGGGVMLGALDDGKLVGLGLLQPELRPFLSQLAFLHVSSSYRRSGIASEILMKLITEARQRRAKIMYVSAAPTGSAVGFYLHHGFKPTDDPIPELLSLEPEDIHMIKNLVQEA